MCDFSSLTKLIRESQGHLLRYAEHFIHDSQTAQDIVQKAYIRYIRFVRKSGGRPGIENLDAWFLTTVRHLCFDELKSASFRLETAWENWEVLPDRERSSVNDSFTLPDEQMEKQEQIAAVRRIITTLSEQEQEVLSLKFEENKKYAEIAGIMGISRGYVGFLLHQAVAKVKAKYIQAEGKEE